MSKHVFVRGAAARRPMAGFAPCLLLVLVSSSVAQADAFTDYRLISRNARPTGAGPMDALADGRMVTVIGNDLHIETSAGSRAFAFHGTLSGADFPSFGPAFVHVSPNGIHVAIGNNGGASFADYRVGVFEITTLTGNWFAAEHFDGAWVDDVRLALTAGEFGDPAYVSLLDTSSSNPNNPDNPVVIENIGGASGGVTLDGQGNLFTGNGFSLSGPSGTGTVRAFLNADWENAVTMSTPLDFENDGVLVVDLLSASPLGFDVEGNLIIGGGDFNEPGQFDYVGLVRESAVAAALAGQGPVDVNNPALVRRLDPNPTNEFNFFTFAYNPVLKEILISDFGDDTVHVYRDTVVPAASAWGLLCLSTLMATWGTLQLRRSERNRIAA
jgi:hypothetical protein